MHIQLRFHPPAEQYPTGAYRVAAHVLVADTTLPDMAACEVAPPEPWSPPPAAAVDAASAPLIYHDLALVARAYREVTCHASAAGYRLEVAGVGTFTVSADGSAVTQTEAAPEATEDVVVETALGPALILALALQGTYCLHAGAATYAGRAVAVAGESGRGKSTLAAFLGEQGGAGWRPLADDVLPFEHGAEGVDALPHFPQLKLPPDRQPALGQPERLPLAALYVLAEPADEVALEPLSPRDAALALVRHTVASRLFAPELLARHLQFCGEVARRVKVRRVHYPRRWEALAGVQELIESDVREQ
jgi:hypothetical protein